MKLNKKMELRTEYGFQFKKILHLLSIIDSEIYILPDEQGTVALTVMSRRHKFRSRVHLDEHFFFTSSLFTYKWQRQILLDVFIWLHMLQNVGVKDSVCTIWNENGNFDVRVKNPHELSISNDLSITSEIIKKRIKLCNDIKESTNTSSYILLETYSVKAPDTDLKYLPELYKEITISIHDSTLTFSAKNNYSQVSIAMQTSLTYSRLKGQWGPSRSFTTSTKLFTECFTCAMEITEGRYFEVHLLSDEFNYNQEYTLRIQFNMSQQLCFLTLDL